MNREEFIQQIRDCGQSIIDNAEKIYNSFEFPMNGIEIMVDVQKDSAPMITIVKKFLPESFIKRMG